MPRPNQSNTEHLFDTPNKSGLSRKVTPAKSTPRRRKFTPPPVQQIVWPAPAFDDHPVNPPDDEVQE